MTKEELIAKMYEKNPKKKEIDKLSYLKRAIIAYFKRNCAVSLNVNGLISKYTNEINNTVNYLRKYIGVNIIFDEPEFGYLISIASGFTRYERLLHFGFNDAAYAIIKPYSGHYELRSVPYDPLGAIKFRIYVDGENAAGSAEYSYAEAECEMLDAIISKAYDGYVFSDEDIQKELNRVLSGESTIWGD